MNKLRVALPKGRLFNDALSFIKMMGIQISEPEGRKLLSKNGMYEMLVARVFDVPVYVEYGIDLGITGSDVVEERESDVFIPLSLPFGKCRLSIAVPENINVSLKEMDGWRIATKYPHITKKFFDKINVDIEIVELKGATEIAPGIGIADAIAEIVEKGTTLKENHLKEIAKISDISALLIVNRISQKTKFDLINHLINKAKEVRNGN